MYNYQKAITNNYPFDQFIEYLCNINHGIFNISGENGSGKTYFSYFYMSIMYKYGYPIYIPETNQNTLEWLNNNTEKFIKNGYTNIIFIDNREITQQLIESILFLYDNTSKGIIIFTSLFPQNHSKKIHNLYIQKNHSIYCDFYIGDNNIDSKILYNKGILGINGKPLSSQKKQNVITNITEINDELMEKLARNPTYMYQMAAYDFEKVIAKLFEKKGYSIRITPQTHDGGKDIFIVKNDICSFLFYIECKKYKPNNHIGIEIIQRLYGVVAAEKATGGIIMTTSYFTKNAKNYITENNLSHIISLKDYDAIQ